MKKRVRERKDGHRTGRERRKEGTKNEAEYGC